MIVIRSVTPAGNGWQGEEEEEEEVEGKEEGGASYSSLVRSVWHWHTITHLLLLVVRTCPRGTRAAAFSPLGSITWSDQMDKRRRRIEFHLRVVVVMVVLCGGIEK